MQELEKILEEIKGLIEKHKNKAYELVAREPLTQCYTEADIEQIKVHELAVVRDIIRKHMTDGWIPVEERMPERTPDEKINNSYKKYLVFIDNIDYWDIDIAVYDLWNDKKWREFSNTYCEIENVTAWCPLPDPYKKIQEENK